MEKLKKILSNLLEISESEITDETSPENVGTWDSFNGLMLVSLLEDEFNVSFTMDDVSSVKCVLDIKIALIKHGINLNESI